MKPRAEQPGAQTDSEGGKGSAYPSGLEQRNRERAEQGECGGKKEDRRAVAEHYAADLRGLNGIAQSEDPGRSRRWQRDETEQK